MKCGSCIVDCDKFKLGGGGGRGLLAWIKRAKHESDDLYLP